MRGDPKNVQILRDLANIQFQLREFSAALETNRKILGEKPIAQNWLCFVASCYLAGSYGEAFQALDAYMRSVKDLKPHEINEVFCFQASCLEKDHKYEELAKFLVNNQKRISDLETYHKKLYRVYFALKDFEKCKFSCEFLLKRNPENAEFYYMLLYAYGIDPKKEIYSESEIHSIIGVLESNFFIL